MNEEWLDTFFSHPEIHPNKAGHAACSAGPPKFGGRHDYDERLDIKRRNLGLGWLYYAIVRMYHVRRCVCIGSGRGFAPIIIAKAMQDDGSGILHFIDPSFDDDFWKERERVTKWFRLFGVEKIITHHLMTTEEFTETEVYGQLKNLELVLIDGCHFYESVSSDFGAFQHKLAENGLIALHDTLSRSANPLWQGPRRLAEELLATGEFQAFDFKLGAGLTLLQRITFEQTPAYLEWCAKQWDSRDPHGF